MSQHDEANRNSDRERVGEAILLKGRIDEIELEQAEQKKRDREYKDRQLANHDKQVKLDGRLVILTGLLVFLGLAGTCISVWQSSIANRNALAAKSSADSALTAVRSDVLSRRAYLTVPGLVANNIVDAKTKKLVRIGIAPRWENTGETPTKTARSISNWDVRTTPMDRSFDFQDRIQVTEPAPLIILAPRAGTNMQRFLFAVSDLQAVTAERAYMYLFGWAIYRDIFPDTPPRLTRYCLRVTRVQFSLEDVTDPRNVVSVNWAQCNAGNCLDEACPDYEARIKAWLNQPTP